MIEKLNPARFFCAARWRCVRCDSPWFGAITVAKAKAALGAHLRAGCP